MKKYKIAFIAVFAVTIAILIILGIISEKTEYAQLGFDADGLAYISVDDSVMYRYTMYCNYNAIPDGKLRCGKNIVFSQFNKAVRTYSADVESNFLYYDGGTLGLQTFGLYVKESYIDDLFKLSNIYEVVITTKDGKQILKFNANDKKVFDYFIKSYSNELKDYRFPSHDDDVYNDDYDIDVYYQNGEVSRWLRSIDRDTVEKLEEYIR